MHFLSHNRARVTLDVAGRAPYICAVQLLMCNGKFNVFDALKVEVFYFVQYGNMRREERQMHINLCWVPSIKK